MIKKLHTTFKLALAALVLFILIPGVGHGQVNNTTPVLLDNYDGIGDLTYTPNALSQWSIAGGIYVAGTNALTTPEHSCTSYDLTTSISGWSLIKANQNIWIGYFKILRTTSGWGTSNYGCGAVLASDLADFSSPSSKGYALVIENGSPDKVTLVKFSAGIIDGATNLPLNATSIVSVAVDPGTTGFNYMVELLSDGKWKISYVIGTQLSDANAIIKASYTGGNTTSASADETYTGSSFKYTGWVFSHSSGNTTTDKSNFDNLGAAQVTPSSSSSDIIGAAHETSNIDYASYQASSIATTADAVRLFSFTMRDGGGSVDADALPTILASTTLTKGASNSVTSWANTIREAALFDGSTKVAEVSVSGESIVFTGLTGANVTADDGGTKTLDLYVTFESAVTDNQQFQFQITNANAAAAASGSSTFSAFTAVLSSSATDANSIEVTATKLVFGVQPSTVSVNTVMSPSPTIVAKDNNNNTDLDFAGTVALSTTGTFSGTTSASAASGTATFNDIKFSAAGTGLTIAGSFTGLTATGNSSTFDVTNPLPEINVKQNVTSIANGGSYGFGSQISGSSSSAITFTIENTGAATLNLSGSPIVVKSGTNASEFTLDQTTTSSTVAAGSNTTFTVTFNPASQGSKTAQLSITNDDITGSENPYLINLTGSGTVTSASDIALTSGYSYTSNMAYASFQSASTLTTGNSVGVNGLTIRDGGASTDADNLGTTMTAISFTTGGSTAIRTAALFDGSTNVSEVAVNGATTIAFTGLSLTAADNGTKAFELRVTYQSTVTDNQQITFTVSSASASATGSGFTAANAGAAVSLTTVDFNRIEVTASKLKFVQQPSDVRLGDAMSPAVTVEATDANDNRDLDYVTNINISSTGTLTGSPISEIPVSGLATYSSLTHTDLGNGLTLTAANGSIASATSNTFSVSTLLLVENFNYNSGTFLTANGWTAHSTGINSITVSSSTISYSGYLSSEIANEISLANNGEDINRTFSAISSGAVYTSFIVNVTSSNTAGDYFFHIGTAPATSIFQGRIYIKKDASTTNFAFGLNKGSTAGTLSYSGFNYIPGTTYLVVMKYAFNTGSTTDDVVSLYVNPALNAGEPTPLLTVTDAAMTDLTKADFVALRQGSASNAATLKLDGIRVAANWADIVGSQPVFTGTGAWSDIGRWSTSAVPGNGAEVVINGVTTIASATTVGGVLINNSCSLTISPLGQLTISGTLTNNAGNTGLVIKSDATGTGSLIHNTASVGATVERYITGAAVQETSTRYHLVSHPFTENYTSNDWISSYLFDCDEVTGTWLPNGASTTATLLATKGYMIYYPGDSHLYTHTGTLQTGTSTIPVTLTPGSAYPGYNLVANMYPCALDFDVAGNWGGPISSTIWMWNATSGNYGAHIRSGANTNGVTNIIPAGQGFFVVASSSGNLTISNAARVHNAAQAYLKNTDVFENTIHITAKANNFGDEIVVQFRNDATKGYDDLIEAKKMTGQFEAPQLSSTNSDGTRLSINALPFTSGDVIVPLAFSLNASTDVTFTASGMESFYESIPMYLEDLTTGTITDLRANPVYTFSHTAGDAGNRFRLRFKGVTGTPEQPTTTPGHVFVSQGKLFVDIPAMQQSMATLSVFDALGRQLISRKEVLQGIVQLPAPTAPGVYIVRVMAGNMSFTGKVVVNQ